METRPCPWGFDTLQVIQYPNEDVTVCHSAINETSWQEQKADLAAQCPHWEVWRVCLEQAMREFTLVEPINSLEGTAPGGGSKEKEPVRHLGPYAVG